MKTVASHGSVSDDDGDSDDDFDCSDGNVFLVIMFTITLIQELILFVTIITLSQIKTIYNHDDVNASL